MSTKIYTAYKLKRSSDLWPVCADAHQKAGTVVSELISRMYVNLASQLPKDPEKTPEMDRCYRLRDAREKVLERYKGSLGSLLRADGLFDVTIGIWHQGKTYYLRPFCDDLVRGALDCLDQDDRLVPYGYWNNSDRPDEVSAAEWGRRRRVWDAIQEQYEKQGNPHFSMEVMSYMRLQNFLGDPFFDLQKKVRAEKLVF